MIFAQQDMNRDPAFLLGVAIAYMLIGLAPFWIAILRGHKSYLAIGALCFFCGWSLVGWVWALIWSLANTGRNDVRVIVQNRYYESDRPRRSRGPQDDFDFN